MRHTRPFVDPVRPVFKGLSDQARDNYDRIFGERPLPNEKDHLDSYVRIGDERILVGSANQPIEKRGCQRGLTEEEIEYGAQKLAEVTLGEKPRKAIITAPGEVHRIELNEIPAGVSLKDMIMQALAETEANNGLL